MHKILIVLFASLVLTSCNIWVENDVGIAQNLPPLVPQNTKQESIERGSEIYSDFCKQCHRPKGKGLGKSFPPLAGSDFLLNKREESIRAVKFGQSGEITVNGKVYNGVMAPMGLEDDEVADVMNYILNSWGNTDDTLVTKEEVSEVKKT